MLANGPLRNDRNGMLVVERIEDGVPIGTVGWHLVHYGPGSQSEAWNFGIELRPEAQGQGLGTEAQRLLAEFLFATYDLNRVEASTDVENLPEQRSLEKAGFMSERGSSAARSSALARTTTWSPTRACATTARSAGPSQPRQVRPNAALTSGWNR